MAVSENNKVFFLVIHFCTEFSKTKYCPFMKRKFSPLYKITSHHLFCLPLVLKDAHSLKVEMTVLAILALGSQMASRTFSR